MQSGDNITIFGYLTDIDRLSVESLFSDPSTRTEETARFTFCARMTLTARHVGNNLFVTLATGTLEIYYDETPEGADFSDPESFKKGKLVARHETRYHSDLNVNAENTMGDISAVADVIQNFDAPFSHDGNTYRFGRRKSRGHAAVNGWGMLISSPPPQAKFWVGLNVISTWSGAQKKERGEGGQFPPGNEE